ncbi:hypothetical protein CLV54_3164 [Compostimonas suwonensis]|uniref:Uncharacterized protein n=1 Tax=Compostimonas suwonensis TaxID=1048394 RepID=A0A2M9BBE9_9MICO|nr:hypothetical protein CLV54_3164 [Compostimonas suwonensis]
MQVDVDDLDPDGRYARLLVDIVVGGLSTLGGVSAHRS